MTDAASDLEKLTHCVVCGRDCSFMALVEGMCMSCGDLLQKDVPELMRGFVRATVAVNKAEADRDRLAAENARLRELMKLEASMARLDQIDPEEVEAQEYKKLLCRIVDLRRQLGVGP